MPFPAVAAIAAGASLLGTGANIAATGRMNKKTRQWNEHMYDRQKNDSLDFWHQQNTYNSPQAQMARLQEAGLNPHLVYGNGSAVQTAGQIDTPHAMPYKPDAPDFNISGAVDGYFNAQTRHQTLENQKAQGDLLKMEALVKDAQIKNTNANTLSTIESTSQSQGSYPLRMSKLHHDITNAYQDITRGLLTQEAIKLDNQGRRLNQTGQNLTNQLKEIELNMRKEGLNPNDPAWMRILFQQLTKRLPWLLKD